MDKFKQNTVYRKNINRYLKTARNWCFRMGLPLVGLFYGKNNLFKVFANLDSPVKISYNSAIEMFCTVVAVNKINSQQEGIKQTPRNRGGIDLVKNCSMHPGVKYLLIKLLWNLQEYGEKDFFSHYKSIKNYLKDQYKNKHEDYCY